MDISTFGEIHSYRVEYSMVRYMYYENWPLNACKTHMGMKSNPKAGLSVKCRTCVAAGVLSQGAAPPPQINIDCTHNAPPILERLIIEEACSMLTNGNKARNNTLFMLRLQNC